MPIIDVCECIIEYLRYLCDFKKYLFVSKTKQSFFNIIFTMHFP